MKVKYSIEKIDEYVTSIKHRILSHNYSCPPDSDKPSKTKVKSDI